MNVDEDDDKEEMNEEESKNKEIKNKLFNWIYGNKLPL